MIRPANMVAMTPLSGATYLAIDDRREDLEQVRRELVSVINAVPTQIYPTEREIYLDAILEDLEDAVGATWTKWPEDVYLLALTAIKSLGRNPIGSETILTIPHLNTIHYHTSLPFSLPPFPSPNSRPTANSAQATEALKILANTLVLHQAGRNRFASLGGGKAVARALAGRGSDGQLQEEEDLGAERLFLLGRIGFCVTLDKREIVRLMVDEEDLVESLVYHISSLPLIPANYMAMSELLKIVYNVITFYPNKVSTSHTTSSSIAEEQPWDEKLDPLLCPILIALHNVPFNDISLPLKQAIHALQGIPFLPRLISTWTSVPSSPEPTSQVRSLLNKLSNMSTSATGLPKKGPGDSTSSSSGGNHHLTPGKSSSRPTSPNRARRGKSPGRSHVDHKILPQRLLLIVEEFFEKHMPYRGEEVDDVPPGLDLDELLAPVLILLVRGVLDIGDWRVVVKDALLPANLDRSPEAGPLESRKGILGDILRLMGRHGHTQSGITAGELMWALHKGDASDLSINIGYGISAGLLFRKGLSGPPPASITEIDDPPSTPAQSKKERNPITSLQSETSLSSPTPLDSMTEEEKEREAERLFVLFDRLEKNKILSVSGGDSRPGDVGKGAGTTGLEEMMRKTLAEKGGEVEVQDREAEERERLEREEEERRDEEDAAREVEELRRRRGRG